MRATILPLAIILTAALWPLNTASEVFLIFTTHIISISIRLKCNSVKHCQEGSIAT